MQIKIPSFVKSKEPL